MIIIFFGPPGAGKGTQASLTSKKLNIPHLSTGDILRSKLSNPDPISLKLKEIIDSGNLVPDDILNEMVLRRVNSNDCQNGFILDGFPRTLVQRDFFSNYLESSNLSISRIFDLYVDNKIIIERIESRSKIENRKDDNTEIIKTRIAKYFEETKPLSDYYSFNYPKNYHVINGNQEIGKIQLDILEIVKKWRFSGINLCFLTWLICQISCIHPHSF